MTIAPVQWTSAAILAELERSREHLEALDVRAIGLFGSYRHDIAGNESDIDFLVEMEHPSFDRYMGLKIWLEDTFGRQVDLVLSDTIKPRLRSVILNEVVYAKGLSPLPGGHTAGDRAD